MKRILYFASTLLLLALFSCGNPSANIQQEEKKIANAVEVQIPVEGMTCEGCENTVNTELMKLSGVESAVASHIDKLVLIQVDTSITSISEMKSAIENVGYTVVNE